MRRPVVILTVLALIWGASFMLIKIADRARAGDPDPRASCLGRAAPERDRIRAPRPAGDSRADPRRLVLARRGGDREHGGAVLASFLGREAGRLRARVDHPGSRPDL